MLWSIHVLMRSQRSGDVIYRLHGRYDCVRQNQLPISPSQVCSDYVTQSTVVRDWVSTSTPTSACDPKSHELFLTVLVFWGSYASSVTRCPMQFSSLSLLCLFSRNFGNVTLASILSFQLHHLQAVMNAAARLVFQSSRYDHITPLLRRLHWLRVLERITYKLAILVYQCIRGQAVAFLADSLQPVFLSHSRNFPLRSTPLL